MWKDKNNPIRQEKIRKREELLKKGVDPYPHNWKHKRTGSLKLTEQFSDLESGTETKEIFYLAGRLMRKRPMGKAAFFNIQDEEGEFQCYIRRDDFPANHSNSEPNPWELWKLCDIGDILGLGGRIFKTKKGELSLKIQDLKILCKTIEALPEKYHGLEDKELKYRCRHLDLIMNQESRKVFQMRSRIIYEIRSFMHKKAFMEVETPVLQPIYGGAEAMPFETHFRRLKQKMYLKISPEIYLKKLIVGGFEKVFEIGKNFRNEGLDRSHNPEFSMMEYYEAYTDYEDQMNQFEELIGHVVKKIKGALKFEYQGRQLDFTAPWKRVSLPDFETLISSCWKEDSIKPVFEFKGKAMELPDFWKIMDSKNNKEFQQDMKNFKQTADKSEKAEGADSSPIRKQHQKILNYIKVLDSSADLEKFKVLYAKKPLPKEELESLKQELSLMAFELTVEKFFWNPVFMMDFPLTVSPLTKKHRKNPLLVERFEPYAAGMEIGNAYTELNDPVDQRERLSSQKRWSNPKAKDSEEAPSHPVDENFLHALEVGMPPTGGVGLGIERLVMILSNQSHIKDSMLFPVLKDKD